jgi:hypothetical protein
MGKLNKWKFIIPLIMFVSLVAISTYGCLRNQSNSSVQTQKLDVAPCNWTSLAEVRQKVSFSIFIPTEVPVGFVPEHPTGDVGSTASIIVNYRTKDGSVGLVVVNRPAGCGLDADPRKKGEIIKLQGNILGHFLNNQPEFGGPILWWEEDGSYVALSGPELTMVNLVKIAASMSPTAEI